MNFHEGLENKFYGERSEGPKNWRKLKRRKRLSVREFLPQPQESFTHSLECEIPAHITILPNGAVRFN